jgi:UDP-N-acetylmuramoylalanine--D-glutamate ligase
VIQNPGVRRDSKFLQIAKKAGVEIENEASLFFKYCPAKIIGVTGTRGKSTTASLIYEILKAENYQRSAGKVWLAGLPQKPMLDVLSKVKPDDWVVLELSSWQLEMAKTKKFQPFISVLTNIYPDHLNTYSGMAEYIAAKKNIFLWQKNGDFTVLNLDNKAAKKLGQAVKGRRFWFSKKYFAEQNGCFVKKDYIYFRNNGRVSKQAKWLAGKLKGNHNLENILAACVVAGVLQIKPEVIQTILKNFSGLPGRIELIKQVEGIKFINDTTATTPDATMAALKTLKPVSALISAAGQKGIKTRKQNNIILIAGGETKNIPDVKYRELAETIKQSCKAVILLSGRASGQLLKALRIFKFKPIISEIGSMTEAVSLACDFAEAGDMVLLSPAATSFNIFVNEYDRGEQFNRAVRNIV